MGMPPLVVSIDQSCQEWGGEPNQRFAPMNRDRNKWKPFQQGRGMHGSKNTPRAPRAISGTLRQQQVPAPEPQMQVPLPGRAHSGLPTTNASRPGPLPADHPLRREMDELKATRKKRQFYWAGLIEDLGDDEWGNPANYDRQRWDNEERLADAKFEELAGQIKLVEMGFPLLAGEVQGRSRSSSAAWGSDQGNTADYNGRPFSRGGRATTSTQQRAREDSNSVRHRTRGRRLDSNFRGSNPNAPPRKEIHWTQQKRASAVDSWMDQMGMNTSEKSYSKDQDDEVHGVMFLGDHVATNNHNSHQDSDANDLQTIETSDEDHEVGRHHENTTQLHWAILDELAFEEAEREREEERLLLARSLEEDQRVRCTIEKDAGSGLQPSCTAPLTIQSKEGVPEKQTDPSVSDPDPMSALLKMHPKEQVGRQYLKPQNPLACSKEIKVNGETSGLILPFVPAKNASNRTSMQLQSSTPIPSTDLNSTTMSDISRNGTTQVASSAVPERLAPPEMDPTHQDHTVPKVAADLMEWEESAIERLDMQNVLSSDDDEFSLHPGPYSEGDDEDNFIHIDDTPRPCSPVPIDNVTPTHQPTSPHQNSVTPNFSALGLHYRNALKIGEIFSSTGTLLPPGPGSVAARFRDLRGSFEDYSSLIRRWAVAGQDMDEIEGCIVVDGVSDWVDVRVWLVNWRERLDM